MNILEMIQLSASLATIVTIVFLFLEQRKQKLAVNNQVYQNFVNNSLEIDRMLIAAPAYRKYIYGNASMDALSAEELDYLMCMTELIADVIDNYDVFKDTIPEQKKEPWEKFVKTVTSSSAWNMFMQESGDWYYN